MKIEHQISLLSILSISILGGAISTQSMVTHKVKRIKILFNFLIVQHRESGSISKINSTTYSLQLYDLADNVFLFSDRPLGFLEDGNQKLDTVVIELFNPKYAKDQNALKYEFNL
jgi:hypothetical protein